ncbi:MAG: hypothetical protein MUF43_12665, partial [Flavobacterium sp.]|nr:hypothetical protein [Flavobacterium sp.]
EKLKFNSDDFEIIENFAFENITYKENISDDELEIFNLLHFYIGEIFIKEIKCAKWDIDLKNSKNFFYKIPTIVLINNMGSPISPYNLVITSLYRQERGLLKRVLINLSKYC